jgi:hypothetical protein
MSRIHVWTHKRSTGFFGRFRSDRLFAITTVLLRFISIVPIGIYETLARTHNDVLNANAFLRGSPYNPSIAYGEQIAANWGNFAFYWNIVICFLALGTVPPTSLFLMVIDLATAVMIHIATNMQRGYVLHSVSACRGPGAHEFQRPPGPEESFFVAAARLSATTTTASDMYESFIKEWQYGIALSLLYSAITAINVVLCVLPWLNPHRKAWIKKLLMSLRKEYIENKSFWKKAWYLPITTPILILVYSLIWAWLIPVLLFRCLPMWIKSRTRYARRWTVKAALHTLRELERKLILKKENMSGRKGGDTITTIVEESATEPVPLADFLGVYDILILTISRLHYADVLSLLQTSKAICHAILPPSSPALLNQRLAHFKRYTCSNPVSKIQCWVCAIQICVDCSRTRRLSMIQLYHHLDACRPYCSTCYFISVASKALPVRTDDPGCQCTPPTATPNVFMKWLNGPNYHSHKTNSPFLYCSVCRTCNVLTDAEIVAKREKRTRAELREPRRWRDAKVIGSCRECKKELGPGARWWVCGDCDKECTDSCHEMWGGTKDEASTEQEPSVLLGRPEDIFSTFASHSSTSWILQVPDLGRRSSI